MAVIIAGREVKKGDSLYHIGYQAWGSVIGFDINSVVLRITGTGAHYRDVHVATGGIAGGRRQVYWHAPLQLDLPHADIGKYQRLLNAIVEEMP